MNKLLMILLPLSFLLFGAGCGVAPTLSGGSSVSSDSQPSLHVEKLIKIKYRDSTVDIADPAFESLNTDRSSFIRGAWYDAGHEYLVLNLSGTYYHYCNLTKNIWQNFKGAASFGTAYNAYIKGKYSCAGVSVPKYP